MIGKQDLLINSIYYFLYIKRIKEGVTKMIPNKTKHENEYYYLNNSINDNETTSEQMEVAVIRFVQSLGIRPNLSGYQTLVKSIMLSLKSPELLDSFSKKLYPEVAKELGKSVQAVERNMWRAIESAYTYDPERIKSVFYYKVDKPLISEVITIGVESIKYKIKLNDRS